MDRGDYVSKIVVIWYNCLDENRGDVLTKWRI